jgi:UDP-glucose 4-epimerase
VATGGFAILNHHAAQMDVRRSVEDPVFDAQVNVLGLLNLLDGARGGGVGRVVFASSGGTVYGNGARQPTPETAPKLPASPYGTAKLSSEYYLATFAELFGLEAVVLRYSNVYGPRQNPHGEAGVVAIFGRRMLDGQPITIYGDGEQTRDLVYVEDVAAANLVAAGHPLPPVGSLDSRAYNIGTGVETTVNQLTGVIAAEAKSASPIGHAPARPGELLRSALDVSKAGRELEWRPRVALSEGIARTLRWIREG